MPTIIQLPEATTVTASDLIPISQDGSVRSVSVGTVLSSVQPTIAIASPSLIGRTSLGAGGPEQVNIGEGLELTNSALAANGTDHANFAVLPSLVIESDLVVSNHGTPMLMPASLLRNLFTAGSNIAIGSDGAISSTAAGGSTSVSGLGSAIGTLEVVTSLSAQDLIAVSQAGSDHGIRYANFLNGITIDQAQLAGPADDTDTIWSAQASNIMMRQNLGSIWTWIVNKVPIYKIPVVELTNDTTLDASNHNGRLLICSQPITLTPLAATMGSGFMCRVINASTGNVMLGSHFITSSGSYIIAPWQFAEIFCIIYSNGSLAFASVGGAPATSLSGQTNGFTGTTSGATSVQVAMPAQVVGVTASATSSSTVQLNWIVQIGVAAAVSYAVQYRITGSSSWTGSAAGISSNGTVISSLQAGTSYDFVVSAVSATGVSLASSIVVATTAAVAAYSVNSITWNVVPDGICDRSKQNIVVNAHISPGTSPVQFGFSPSTSMPPTSWSQASYVNTDLWGAYVPTPSSTGSWFVWGEGVDGSCITVNATPFVVQ